MSQTWYRVSEVRAAILPVEVIKNTAKFITIKSGHGERRTRIGREYFRTFEEAQAAGIAMLLQQIEWGNNRLVGYKSSLETLRSMVKP